MDDGDKDKRIINMARSLEKMLPNSPAVYLNLIVVQSDSLDQQYADISKCQNLLVADSEISKLLDECIKSGKFQRIRDLEKLQRKPSSASIIDVPESGESELGGPMIHASHDAFTQTFVGDGDDILLSTLDHYLVTASTKPRAYNLSFPIIQSSGMGKSRVVDKAAEKRLTFPLNLRGKIYGVKAYPPPDVGVLEYFIPAHSDTDEILQRKFFFFLVAMFQTAIPIIKEFKGNYSSVALQWHSYLANGQTAMSVGSNRKQFYKSVIDAAKLNTSNRRTDKLEDILSTASDVVEDLRKALPNDCPVPQKNAFCIVSLDEAHTLATKHNALDKRKRTAYDNLGTVLSMLWEYKDPVLVFFLFLSTNSNLRVFSPPTSTHPSARDWSATRLSPPYTELPFDTFPQNIVSRLKNEERFTLNGVCSLDEIIRFGRPLWHSQMTHLDPGENLIQFAVDKLISDGTISLERYVTKSDVAALDIRILLGFDSLQPVVRELESILVESNMRTVYSVPEHRGFMRSGYPSEPLLAEAAARILNGGSSANLEIREAAIEKNGPQILSEVVGFLARGERGEMVARLLMTIAHDRAILKTPKMPDDLPIFHQPVKVLNFLKALFHDRFYKRIANAKPVSNLKGKTLGEAFEGAYMNFSHFSKAGDSEAVHLNNLWLTLVRGNALQCVGHQVSIDMAWAIFFGDPSQTPIDKSKISTGHAQIKNVLKPGHVLVDPTTTSSNPDLPSLSLVLQLGSKHKNKRSLVKPYNFDSSSEGPHENHYQIVAHGCSSDTYSAIPSECNRMYESILAEGCFADDFPRSRMEENRRALYSLKPEFYGKTELKEMSWDWA